MKYKIALTIIVGLLLIGCSKSTIIDMAFPRNVDTVRYHRIVVKDTVDTVKVPINFGVSIDNWGDETVIESN